MLIKFLGNVDYLSSFADMQEFTQNRTDSTADEIWICEHPPTFTQGLAGKTEHLLSPTHIPIIQTNRGGQVTFHGPGQIVAYPLIDLKRLGIFVKEYVYRLEEAILKTLLQFKVTGHRVQGAPGIYIILDSPFGHQVLKKDQGLADMTSSSAFSGLGKIAALGIKVSRNKTYHGLSLNVQMDLRPFDFINPCGFKGLKTIDLSTIGCSPDKNEVAQVLTKKLEMYLS
jgi:lipoyl(octanoyl) transferase